MLARRAPSACCSFTWLLPPTVVHIESTPSRVGGGRRKVRAPFRRRGIVRHVPARMRRTDDTSARPWRRYGPPGETPRRRLTPSGPDGGLRRAASLLRRAHLDRPPRS